MRRGRRGGRWRGCIGCGGENRVTAGIAKMVIGEGEILMGDDWSVYHLTAFQFMHVMTCRDYVAIYMCSTRDK